MINKSKTIVEAAGDYPCKHRKTPWNGKCFVYCYGDNIPDLSLPENGHILRGYVEKICDTDEKRDLFGDYMASAIGRFFKAETEFYREVYAYVNAPNEAIMDALIAVIREGEDG